MVNEQLNIAIYRLIVRTIIVEQILILWNTLERHCVGNLFDVTSPQVRSQRDDALYSQPVAGEMERRVALAIANVYRGAPRHKATHVMRLVLYDR